jgi:hypothetical protein
MPGFDFSIIGLRRFFRPRSSMTSPGKAWIAYLLGLLLVFFAGESTVSAYQESDSYPGTDQVVLTKKALRHIMERHWPDSTAEGAGKFQTGITPESLLTLINEAVQNGRRRSNTHGRPGAIYEYDFRRQIGINIDGQSATRLRVVVNNRNQVITAFPF